MAVVQDRERVGLVLRNILGSKTPVGYGLLAEGAKPEWVGGASEPGTASVRASERPQVGGTGHSQMELLWRVLAEGESAPSARQRRNIGERVMNRHTFLGKDIHIYRPLTGYKGPSPLKTVVSGGLLRIVVYK